jgi:ribonuclease VapC
VRPPPGVAIDCFAYALAKTLAEPLLFKGEDFARTDVARVELPPRP